MLHKCITVMSIHYYFSGPDILSHECKNDAISGLIFHAISTLVLMLETLLRGGGLRFNPLGGR